MVWKDGSADDHDGRPSAGTDAGAGGELMAVCYRQSKRIWRRYRPWGTPGLVLGAGQPSGGASRPKLRAQALALYGEERYADFGPTLMAEHLAKKAGGGSRDVAALAAGGSQHNRCRRRKQVHRQCGNASRALGDGATGRVAPRLVRGAGPGAC